MDNQQFYSKDSEEKMKSEDFDFMKNPDQMKKNSTRACWKNGPAQLRTWSQSQYSWPSCNRQRHSIFSSRKRPVDFILSPKNLSFPFKAVIDDIKTPLGIDVWRYVYRNFKLSYCEMYFSKFYGKVCVISWLLFHLI